MGNVYSCTSKGALLLVAAANGDLVTAQELLSRHPKAASHYNFKDRSSPLLLASARGHFELVQLILETAVMTEGPERAKKNCIDHSNSKRQTALMVACKHGHPDCVEYLVTNGGDPLLTDERRHNTCLHFAALYGHSECVHKLLGSRAAYRVQGRQVPVAQIPCVDDGVTVKFIDRHNGWGLSALHIAVFQGSVSTVRALLRHGADVESVICASKVENSPIRCAVGSNALHIAALTGNIQMAKLILETQESYPGLELRSRTNAAGLKPHDYAQSARNPVLMHLLDERLPVTLLRQIWMNHSTEQSLPPRHQTLGSMLQKLKLMFNLELIAIQRNVTHLHGQQDVAAAAAATAQQQQQNGQAALSAPQQPEHQHQQQVRSLGSPAGGAALLPPPPPSPSSPVHEDVPMQPQQQQPQPRMLLPPPPLPPLQISLTAGSMFQQSHNMHSQQHHALGGTGAAAGALVAIGGGGGKHHRGVEPASARLLWARRQDEIAQLLATVTQLHENLKHLCRRDDATGGEAGEAALGRATTYEAVLDFILSTLVNPRTVSAILHAAKKLVSASVNGTAALTAGGAPLELPPGDSDSQHGLALLSTALRAVETCLQAAVTLTTTQASEQQQQLQQQQQQQSESAAPYSGGANLVSPAGTPGDNSTTTAAGPGRAAPAPVTAFGAGGETGPLVSGSGGEPQAAPVSGGAGSGSAALVSDQVVVEVAHGTGPQLDAPSATATAAANGANSAQPLPRPATLAVSPLPLGNAGLLIPQFAARGAGVGGDVLTPPSFATHWSSQLNTLIAQLQWDIGVQRHRRRRAHAQAAARSAAAAAVAAAASTANNAASAAQTEGTPTAAEATAAAAYPVATPAGPAVAPGVRAPGDLSLPMPALRVATGVGSAASPAAGSGVAAPAAAPVSPVAVHLLRALGSRRGDAVQDVVTSNTSAALPALPQIAHSRSDSGVSTPVAGVAVAAPAIAAPILTTPPSAGLETAGTVDTASTTRTADDIGRQPILFDEIIPQAPGGLSSGRLVRASAPSAAAPGGENNSSIRSGDAAAASEATAPSTAAGGNGNTGPAAGDKRAGGGNAGDRKDRGKEGAAAGAGGDGGLDAQDDSPAASESGSDWSDDDRNVCSICMDLPVAVLVAGCQHGLCVQCAFQLCVKGRELPSCPFCRQKIGGFEAKEMAVPGNTPAASAPGGTAVVTANGNSRRVA